MMLIAAAIAMIVASVVGLLITASALVAGVSPGVAVERGGEAFIVFGLLGGVFITIVSLGSIDTGAAFMRRSPPSNSPSQVDFVLPGSAADEPVARPPAARAPIPAGNVTAARDFDDVPSPEELLAQLNAREAALESELGAEGAS